MKAAEQSGYFPIQPFITLNSEMEEAFLLNHQEYILLESNPSGDKNPPTFKVGILGTSLVINATDNPLYENYIDGMGLEKVVINPPHTPVLFTNVARKNTVIVPVKNQPGWFLFSNKSETFLISSTSQIIILTDIHVRKQSQYMVLFLNSCKIKKALLRWMQLIDLVAIVKYQCSLSQ